MEVVSTNEKQTVTKVEAPNEDALTYKGWGEPAPKRAKVTWDILKPTDEVKYFTDRAWEPDTATQKKSAELLAIYETDRVFVKDGTVWYRSDLKTYCLSAGHSSTVGGIARSIGTSVPGSSSPVLRVARGANPNR